MPNPKRKITIIAKLKANVFLVPFSCLICINVVINNRRRYGVFFGVTAYASWSFSADFFMVYLTLALGTLVVYTILKKPKVTIFWVLMLVPLGLLASIWINNVSRPLGIVTTISSVALYAFIIPVSRIPSLDKLNTFFLKIRYILPASFCLALLVAAIYISISTDLLKVTQTVLRGYYMFDHYNIKILQYVQIGFYVVSSLAIISYTFVWSTKKQKITSTRLALILIIFALLFAMNPLFTIITSESFFKIQATYLSTLWIFGLIVGVNQIISLINPNKINNRLAKTKLKNHQLSPR